MFVPSSEACSVQNSAMPAPASVVAASRSRVSALESAIQTAQAAMMRGVNRLPSDFSSLGLVSGLTGANPPFPYGSGLVGTPGVAPNNGGGGADNSPQSPYVDQPWPVGLPARSCSPVVSILGAPANAQFSAPLSAASYRAPAGARVAAPPAPGAATSAGPVFSRAAADFKESQRKLADTPAGRHQKAVADAIAAADPSGSGKVELIYPGQSPGAPRYAAGYGSPEGMQPAVYVNGRLVSPSVQLGRGVSGLGCADCGGGPSFLTSMLGSLVASGVLIAAWSMMPRKGGA